MMVAPETSSSTTTAKKSKADEIDQGGTSKHHVSGDVKHDDDKSHADVSAEKTDLPPGWLSKLKTKGGRRDWYFTDPVSGLIFRSRKDVFRYLQTGDVNKCATRPKMSSNNDSHVIIIANQPPSSATIISNSSAKRQHLFAGNGNSSVSNSSVFNAENDSRVTRASSKFVATKRFTRGSAKPEHVLSSANKTPSKLAAKSKGRLELRNLMSPNIEGDTSTRRVTRGYSKQSTKQLPMDHVEEETPNSDGASIKIGSAKTNGIDIVELNGVDPPNSEDSTMKRFTRGSTKTNGTDIESSKDDSPNFKDASIKRVTRGSAKTNGIDIEVGVNFDPICSVVSPVKDLKRKHGKMVDTAQCSPSPVKDPNTKVAKKDSTQNGAKERITRKKQEEMNATRRSSRRHAAIASKPLVNINSEAQKQTPQAIAREENVDAIVALNMIVDSVAQWASQQLASIPELARKSSPAVPGDINNVEPSDKSTSIPCENQTDPKLFGCLDAGEKLSSGNQTETGVEYLQSEKNGNQESQPSFVFGDSWADPCLEFAYKTLTSDLPMENNQNYFQPQPYCPPPAETLMVIDDGLVLRIPNNTFDSTTTSDAPVTPVFGQRSRAFIPSIDVNIPFNPQESSFDERNKNHN